MAEKNPHKETHFAFVNVHLLASFTHSFECILNDHSGITSFSALNVHQRGAPPLSLIDLNTKRRFNMSEMNFLRKSRCRFFTPAAPLYMRRAPAGRGKT
jgi:hypothetical protein